MPPLNEEDEGRMQGDPLWQLFTLVCFPIAGAGLGWLISDALNASTRAWQCSGPGWVCAGVIVGLIVAVALIQTGPE